MQSIPNFRSLNSLHRSCYQQQQQQIESVRPGNTHSIPISRRRVPLSTSYSTIKSVPPEVFADEKIADDQSLLFEKRTFDTPRKPFETGALTECFRKLLGWSAGSDKRRKRKRSIPPPFALFLTHLVDEKMRIFPLNFSL